MTIKTFTVNVIAGNDTPIAVADTNTIAEDTTTVTTDAAYGVLANDTDADTGDTKAVTTVGDIIGVYGSLNLSADGHYTYTMDNTNATVQALGVGQAVPETFNYTMKDTAGATSSSTLTITITGTNDQPVVTSSAIALTQAEDVTSAFTVGNLLTNASSAQIWSDTDSGTTMDDGYRHYRSAKFCR